MEGEKWESVNLQMRFIFRPHFSPAHAPDD